MLLHDYSHSSAAYRVRIAINVKGIDVDRTPLDLTTGAQSDPAYRALNPMGLVPALQTDAGVLGQSLAIIGYLDDTFPEPPLLPEDAWARARVWSMALTVACDIHPLNNLSVRHWLTQHGASDAQVVEWVAHWIGRGFEALEQLADDAGPYLAGDQVTLADVCLVPQVFNARRFDVALEAYPRLVAIDAALNALPAFQAAHPDRQPGSG